MAVTKEALEVGLKGVGTLVSAGREAFGKVPQALRQNAAKAAARIEGDRYQDLTDQERRTALSLAREGQHLAGARRVGGALRSGTDAFADMLQRRQQRSEEAGERRALRQEAAGKALLKKKQDIQTLQKEEARRKEVFGDIVGKGLDTAMSVVELAEAKKNEREQRAIEEETAAKKAAKAMDIPWEEYKSLSEEEIKARMKAKEGKEEGSP